MKLGSTNGSIYSRPKLNALRSSYSSLRSPKSVVSGSGLNTNFYDKDIKPKKSRSRKQSSNYYGSGINGTSKMDYLKKRSPNYTDLAYREAVTRLRYLLNESYNPVPSKYNGADSGEETDDRSFLGNDRYPIRTFSGSRLSRRYPVLSKENVNILRPTLNNQITTSSSPAPNVDVASQDGKFSTDANKAPPELMTFIEKQEEYIEQLERESQYCRDELSGLLSKVKDVISENESLHEKQKDGFIRSIFDNIRDSETEDSNESDVKTVELKEKPSKKVQLEGPSIVFESRISELEAQLTQAKIELKNLQEENIALKRKECLDCYHGDSACKEGYKKQIDNLQRDKNNLEATIAKLQTSLVHLRDAETDSVLKSKRNQGLLEQMIFEKNQSDAEVRRLKDELEKQYERVREANHETARRVAEERAAADKRYCAQVDQLGGDLSNQWETANKLQLELERQRRIESDYKREITSRNHQIDDLKTELRNKTASLQSDLAQCNAEKQSLEEEIATLRLSLERADRNSKSEVSRLNSEITSLRQRLDRSDSDLLQARRENLRLSEQLANLQKEITLGSLTTTGDENPKKEMALMIHDMENKHRTGNTEERNESDSHSICQPINRTETETVAQPEPSTGTSRSIELLSNQESCDVKQDDSRSDNNENEHCNVKIKVHDNLENNEIKIEEGKSLKSSPITVDINVRLVPRSGKSRPK